MRKNYAFLFLICAVAASLAYARSGDLSTTSSTVQSFTVSCGATPTAIIPPSGFTSYTDLRCGALGSTAVFIGGAAVAAATGYPICTSTTACVENAVSVSVGRATCIVAAGTETLNCIAIGN